MSCDLGLSSVYLGLAESSFGLTLPIFPTIIFYLCFNLCLTLCLTYFTYVLTYVKLCLTYASTRHMKLTCMYIVCYYYFYSFYMYVCMLRHMCMLMHMRMLTLCNIYEPSQYIYVFFTYGSPRKMYIFIIIRSAINIIIKKDNSKHRVSPYYVCANYISEISSLFFTF